MEVWVVCLISLRDFGIEKGEREIKGGLSKLLKMKKKGKKKKGEKKRAMHTLPAFIKLLCLTFME